jgi:ABC-2 type transport system ATP-binding protein
MTATAAARPAVAVSDLRMRYGPNDVLHGVSFAVERGEVVTLLGPNGAGKTTIIEILEGFRRPSAGAVEVLGTDPAHADEDWRARVGIVLQSWRDHGKWRVRQLLHNLGRFYEPYATADRPRPRPVDELIETVGLTEQANQRISTLSGGQRRRLDVAIGLIGRPELLVLDEPTAGVDPQSRREFWETLFALAATGTTVFVSTHYMDEAVRCHRLCILREGRRVALGTPEALARPLAARVLDVRVPEVERAIAALRDFPLVASTTQLGATVHVLLRAEAPPATLAAQRLVGFLADAGLPGAEASPSPPNLEDVFVALLLGERLDPGEGGPGEPRAEAST